MRNWGEESRMTSGDAAWVRVLYFPEWGFISRWDKGNTVKFLSDRGEGVVACLGGLLVQSMGPWEGWTPIRVTGQCSGHSDNETPSSRHNFIWKRDPSSSCQMPKYQDFIQLSHPFCLIIFVCFGGQTLWCSWFTAGPGLRNYSCRLRGIF